MKRQGQIGELPPQRGVIGRVWITEHDSLIFAFHSEFDVGRSMFDVHLAGLLAKATNKLNRISCDSMGGDNINGADPFT